MSKWVETYPDPDAELDANGVAEVMEVLGRSIVSARKSIRVVITWGEDVLYSHPTLVRALSRAAQRGVRTRISSGPMLTLARKDGEPYSGIAELQRRQELAAYRRSCDGGGRHLLLVDDRAALEIADRAPEDESLSICSVTEMSDEQSVAQTAGWIARKNFFRQDRRIDDIDKGFLWILHENLPAFRRVAQRHFPTTPISRLDGSRIRQMLDVMQGEREAEMRSLGQVLDSLAPRFGILDAMVQHR